MASKDHGLTPIELSSFCSEIALMLGAGMPLYAGMEALEKTYEDDAHAALYRGVSETLTQTGSLRDALESAHAFPTYLVEMCGVGERTGHLEDVMQGLSVYYERESRIRQAVRSAVTYPLVLAVMMVLILLVLILKVMPVFRAVLGSMGVTMTETGRVMMSVGTALGFALGLLVAIIRTIALPEKKKTGSNVGVTLRRGLLRLAQLLMNVYIQVFRGTPMIVQAVVIYYGAQYAGVFMDTTFAAIFIISINTGAYMAEIIRGGIVSVDKGQFEAAHAIGMTHWQTMTTVVLPQAIRNILPSVGNELIVNIKDSSVLNVISVSELFFQAKSAAGTYYRYFEVYFIIAVIYLILTLSVSAILRAVEKKMDGPDNYVIHGSQSDSRADIKVSVENEKEAVKRWNV